jgi:glycosyltransferase involved in cell wall biosynthesis
VRALFVNSGILGHRAVAGLLRETLELLPSIDATHVDLSLELTLGDRLIRRMFSLPLAPRLGPAGNLDLRRWREELNLGLLAARRISRAERTSRFDVLHFHTQASAYASVARMKHTPAIVSIDATQQLASLEAGSTLSRLTYRPNMTHDGRVFARAAAITATSEWAGRDLSAHYPSCASRVHVMPYPVRAIADECWIRERARLETTGEPPRRVRVLFVGGDFPRKGGPELLEAWRAGAFAGRATLDLVTDWPIAGEEIPDGVRLVRNVAPYTPAWLDLWRRADVFVMPTRREAFGMVFQEAAAAGVPAIGTRINAIPEIVIHGVTGMLVEPGDRDSLVRTMCLLVESAELRHRLGAAAFDRMRIVGAPDRYASRLASLLHAAVENHGSRQT